MSKKSKITALLITFVFLLSAGVKVCASDVPIYGNCGPKVTWSFDGETLTVSGSGPTGDFDRAPWDGLRQKISRVVVEEGITSVGDYAFYDCCNLREAVLADSIRSIGDMAFCDTRLKEIRFPKNLTTIGVFAFYNSKLEEIKLPDGLRYIHQMAFGNCRMLKSVVLPDSLQIIELGAFSGCDALEKVRYKGTREQWVNTSISRNDELLEAGIRFDGDLFRLSPAGTVVLLVSVGGVMIIYHKEKRKKYENL